MRGFGGVPVLFLGLALAGCAGTLEQGDVAYAKGETNRFYLKGGLGF